MNIQANVWEHAYCMEVKIGNFPGFWSKNESGAKEIVQEIITGDFPQLRK